MERELAQRPRRGVWAPRQVRVGDALEDPSRRLRFGFEFLQQAIDQCHVSLPFES
jgi:hypothetical protein